MSPQHVEEGIYLAYLTGELPAEEKPLLERHLDSCPECRVRFEQYRELMRAGLPSIADEMTKDVPTSPLPWSLADGEKRLYAAIENQEYRERSDTRSELVPLVSPQSGMHQTSLRRGAFDARARAALAIAATILLAFGLAESTYRVGLKRGLEQARQVTMAAKPVTPAPIIQSTGDKSMPLQLHKLVLERDAIQAGLLERDAEIARLKERIEKQRKQSEAIEASFHLTDLQAKEQTQQISSQRDDLARKLEDQQAVLTATQKKLESIQQEGAGDILRVNSLENRIQQMTQLLKDKDATIDEQQRLLSASRDIRDLMGARDLYIAEVYDVGSNGKKKKPYGRVFLTKGKSLVFYAYDLDQQPGLKNTSTFQAWGLRGPDRNSALNLGVMYVDNSTNKRWVLQFDDPKVLEKINAVFVTVEPSGGSRVPSGQQVLFAYLGEEPNHP